jgi:hypothetical protein
LLPLQHGQIVWAEVYDQRGRNPKCRPAVILTATHEIVPGELIVAVAVTSRFDLPVPANKVRLPWQSGRHPVTKLYKPCVAVCDWLVEFTPEQVRGAGGVLPTHLMNEIVRRATG